MKKQTKRSYLALNYLQNYQTMGNKIENKIENKIRKWGGSFSLQNFTLVFYRAFYRALKLPLAFAVLGFSFLVYTVLGGVNSLQAQEKGGWFVGVTPYVLGLSEQKSSIVANLIESTEDSGFSFTAVASSDSIISGTSGNGSQALAEAAAVRICETGFASTDGVTNGNFAHFQFSLSRIYDNSLYSFDVSTHCRDHFAGLLSDAIVPQTSPKAATAKWSGTGLQFGYQFPEGNRFSLQLHNWKGGDSEVSSQMVIYDYFLTRGFYAGLGAGTIQLKALGKTESQTGFAVNLGWQYSLNPSLKLDLGYLLLNANASITKKIEETRNARAEVEAQTVYLGFDVENTSPSYQLTCHVGQRTSSSCDLDKKGVIVTSEPFSKEISYEIIETQEVTISKPSAIYIRLQYHF